MALIKGIELYGLGRWADIAAALVPGRTGKQCQLRWKVTLNPDIKRGTWTAEEVL